MVLIIYNFVKHSVFDTLCFTRLFDRWRINLTRLNFVRFIIPSVERLRCVEETKQPLDHARGGQATSEEQTEERTEEQTEEQTEESGT